MIHPWQPFEQSDGREPEADRTTDTIAEWAELFATAIAHMAAQLTMTQLRLRALASVAAESGAIDRDKVASRLSSIAEFEAGRYLRENLGAELADAIDVDDLSRDIVSFLQGETDYSG